MSLYLSQKELNKRFNKKKLKIPKHCLTEYIQFTKNNYLKYSSKQLLHKKIINPLLWQYGHVIFFYITHVFKNLGINHNLTTNIELIEFYDSFKTPNHLRIRPFMLDYYKCIEIYKEIIEILLDYINKNKIGIRETYLIMLGVLHNEMHNESFIFCSMNLGIPVDYPDIYIKSNKINLILNPEFIKYSSGVFKQGSKEGKKHLVFDNEMPRFKKKIEEFSISRYPITEHMFSVFIRDGGYTNDDIWSKNGLFWRKSKKIRLPLYWVYLGDKFFKKINGQIYETNTNLPMSNVSYYEAEAFCKYYNFRLPSESEFEYVSTNMGKTKYPWGDNIPYKDLCNINYCNNIAEVDSLDYKNGENSLGVSQLIGNIWEWCVEPIYPYDGFVIDPVYREISYPFFGYKKICKGGCFAVSEYLISPQYRNAQYPSTQEQFIGFRVCKKK